MANLLDFEGLISRARALPVTTGMHANAQSCLSVLDGDPAETLRSSRARSNLNQIQRAYAKTLLAAQELANVLPAAVPLQGVPQQTANSPPQNPQNLQLVPVTNVPAGPIHVVCGSRESGVRVVSVQSTIHAPWWHPSVWVASTTGYIKVQCEPLVTVIQNCVLPIGSIVLLSSLGFVYIVSFLSLEFWWALRPNGWAAFHEPNWMPFLVRLHLLNLRMANI
jgi:hypothetical protein